MDKVVIAISIQPQGSASIKPQISYDEAVNKFLSIEQNIDGEKMRKMLKFLDTLRDGKENESKGVNTRIEEETQADNNANKLFE